MFLAHAWRQNSNDNNGRGVLAHKHLALHSRRCLVSAWGQNNGVKIYCQRAEPGSAGWQLRADRWPGTQGSPVFILMNVCDFPGPHHYNELCGFCSTWKSLLGISLYGDTCRLIPKLSRNEWYALHASGLLLDKRTWLLRTEDKMNYIMYTWSYIKRRILENLSLKLFSMGFHTDFWLHDLICLLLIFNGQFAWLKFLWWV